MILYNIASVYNIKIENRYKKLFVIQLYTYSESHKILMIYVRKYYVPIPSKKLDKNVTKFYLYHNIMSIYSYSYTYVIYVFIYLSIIFDIL